MYIIGRAGAVMALDVTGWLCFLWRNRVTSLILILRDGVCRVRDERGNCILQNRLFFLSAMVVS